MTAPTENTEVQGTESSEEGVQADHEQQNQSTEEEAVGTVSLADYEKLKARMQAADRRASETQKKLDSIHDANKSEEERLKDEHERYKTLADKLQRDLEGEKIRNEFLSNTKYTFENNKAALKLLDFSGIAVNESGGVEGMSEALDTLATEYPFLLKKEEAPKEEKKKEPKGPTGGNFSPGNKKKEEPTVDKNMFPALFNR